MRKNSVQKLSGFETPYIIYSFPQQICDKVKKSKGWTIQQENKDSMGPYAYRGNQWISYDDPDMIRVKVGSLEKRLFLLPLTVLEKLYLFYNS